MRIRKYINKEIISWSDLPNSLSYHHKNYMADSKEVYFRDLENERVKYMYVINKYGKFNTLQCGQDYFFLGFCFWFSSALMLISSIFTKQDKYPNGP